LPQERGDPIAYLVRLLTRPASQYWPRGYFAAGPLSLSTAAMLMVQLMKRYLPPVTAVFVLTEGLTVFAWVALWRPGELLLYEWYPFKRDARLFRKLERCEVRFSYNTR
jgi:hypothetical protein